MCYLTNDADNAEDFTNEVFLRLCRALQTGAIPQEALPGWLYRVGRNLVIDEYRRHLAEANGVRFDDATIVITPLEETFLNLDVRSVFEQLTPEQQKVLYLRFVEGFEPSEIAGLMGKSAGAVKQLQYRALATLRRLLRQDGYNP